MTKEFQTSDWTFVFFKNPCFLVICLLTVWQKDYANFIMNLLSLVLFCTIWWLLCVCVIYQIFEYLQLHIRFSSSKEHCVPSETVFGGTYVSKTGEAGTLALLLNTKI